MRRTQNRERKRDFDESDTIVTESIPVKGTSEETYVYKKEKIFNSIFSK